MLVPILVQGSWYQLKLWKRFVLAVLLTAAGTIGTYLLFFVENGKIGGISFYGAVFFVPIIFLLIAKILREPYKCLMDICAVAECAMLAIMKVQCVQNGCCSGKIFTISDRVSILFPSQIAEMINGTILLVILLILSRNKKYQGSIYPLYMLLYGTTRFILNLFRADQSVFLIGLTAGSLWSLISVGIGFIWMLLIKKE